MPVKILRHKEIEAMKKTIIATAILSIFIVGCSTPNKVYKQLPLELRVIHVESSRANLPRELFTGPLPQTRQQRAVPGTMEAIAVIAKAISECFKWGFQSASYQSEHAVQHGFISVDIVSLRWGKPNEPIQSAQMWKVYDRFMDKMPTPLPMYQPELKSYMETIEQLQRFNDVQLGDKK